MRRFSKTALSLLISLLIVLGQLPWISITVHAEPTEELLTTITATGQEQASYSTENVATISFSYTANGSSSYYAGWGWWGYGWIATVTPADGYKITKCVFYDDANRTATDSEAPFVVKTTEEDKEPQVNGTPILAYQSKGIKKIEVYGYATSAASYSVTYNTNGGTINSGNITEYTEGTGATLPTDVTKEGYVFVGWYDNESLTGSSVSEISETDTGDKEYWAMWVESLVGKTYPVDGTGNLVIERATRFADGQGSTATVPSGTYAISFDNLTDSTCLYRLSGNRIYIANDTTKRIKALTIVEGTGLPGNPYVFAFLYDNPISITVNFSVVNGLWDDGTTTDKTVTLTGYEGDTLQLAAGQIPAVGSNPDVTYKAGSWDTTPTAGMEITADTTFTYTYVAKTPISYTVTFNVENGSWNNGGSDAQTVTLTGYEGDTLTLAASQIPAVGLNPDATYKAGSWDTTPTAGMEITADTTFTYTYAAKTPISYTVTFNVENGSWNNGGSDAQTVTLTGYEGDTLNLAASQIPEVGSNPDATYKAGSWDTTPTAGMVITADTTFTYTYAAKTPISYTVTFNVENGSWDEGGSDAQTVTLTGYEGDTLTLAASQIPAVGSNPDATYKAGSWDTIPTAGMEITADTTFTYSYVKDNTAPITYTNTEGEGSNYTLGTNGTLTFRFSRSENDAETINHFTGIKVDNIEVSSSNYTYSAGSVIINLKPEYLQTLSVGQHTLTAMFDDGGDVTVNFTIVAAAQNTPTPTPAPTPAGTAIASTGETFPMTVLYGIAMLIASVLCIAVMSFIKPKKYKVRKVKL